MTPHFTSTHLTSAVKLEFIEVVTHEPVEKTVIWLHGLGADGHDFAHMVPQLRLPSAQGIRFIFPHAPIRPITINQGMSMRAWYDITSLTSREDDVLGIEQSRQAIEQLILQQQQAGIDPKKIILAGFSQGGAMALQVALRYPLALGGVLVLSGYLPAASLIPVANQEQSQMPIALFHGEYDEIIPIQLAEYAREILLQRAYTVAWQHYPMRHEVCQSEIRGISEWIMKIPSRT